MAEGVRACRVERWDYAAGDKSFGCAKVFVLPLAIGAAGP
jgi:hypothetical protein